MSDLHPNSRDDHDARSETEEGEAHGNRPAHGARQASPGQVLSGGFQGSANAGDFLGLDLEVSEPAAGPGDQGGLELSSVDPYAASREPQSYGDFSENAPVEDFGDEPPPVEAAEHYGEEDFEDEVEELAPPRPTGRLVALAFLVGLVGVVGVVMGPKLLRKERVGSSARVDAPTTAAPRGPAAPSGAPAATVESPSGGSEVTELVGSPADVAPSGATGATDPRPPAGGAPLARPSGGEHSAPREDAEAPSLVDVFRRLSGGGGEQGPAAGGDPAPGAVSQLPRLDESDPIDGTTFDASLFSPEAWMSGELVDMVWRDTSVPLEAIAHPVRIMTPRVGFVRVLFADSTVVEGRLYAVGQNRVWLENDLGRLGLDGEGVVGFERLHPEEVQTASFEGSAIGKGKRVRVHVPGGALYGRVLSVIDENVVLVTDAGARVTLHAPEIEPLGPSRAVLVER